MSDDEHDCDLCHAAEGKWLLGDWMACDACTDSLMSKLEALNPDDDDDDREDGTG
jgi:hypothetical protein